jgi:hypothetical protein
MWKAFPTALSISGFSPTVVLQFRDLLSKLWPSIIVGLPVIFITEEQTVGFEYDRLEVSSPKSSTRLRRQEARHEGIIQNCNNFQRARTFQLDRFRRLYKFAAPSAISTEAALRDIISHG